MVIKANKGMIFVGLTKTTAVNTCTNYNGCKYFEFTVWDNNKNEYSTHTLNVKDKTDFEKATNGLFMAIQRGAKTVDIDKYVME